MSRKRFQYPSVSRVIKIPTAYPVVPGGDFSDFDLVLKPKSKQLDSFPNTVYLPTPVVSVTVGGDFADFDLPIKTKVFQGSFTNTPIVPPDLAILGDDFSDFELPVKSKFLQVGFTNTPFVPQPVVVQNYVFSSFEQPQFKRGLQDQPVQFEIGFLGPAQTPPWFVFSEYSQPRFKPYPVQEQPDVIFRILLPDAPTPSDSGIFPQFSQPFFSKYPTHQQPDTFFEIQPPPVVVVTPTFSGFVDWEIPSKKSIQEGFITNSVFIPIQNVVFSSFSQPQTKRILQVDNSFVNLPIVVFQPYVFGQFSQPQFKREIKEGQIQFEVGFLGPAQTPPWFVFGQFEQPTLTKTRLGDFSNTPQPQFVQVYVFSKFEQPVSKKLLLDTSPSSIYLPAVIIPPPVFTGFTDFGLPQQLIGTQRNQDGSYNQFQIIPPPPFISPLVFSGFSNFGLLPTKTSYKVEQHPQVIYQILLPEFLLENVFSGRRWHYPVPAKKELKQEPKVFKVDSSNLEEVSYDKEAKELQIKFKTYKYENVSPKRVKGLLNAESHGKYFHSNIKGKYPTCRLF